MGLVTTTVLLRNPRIPTLAIQVDALADTGSLHLCIPQRICDHLGLQPIAQKQVTLADGSSQLVAYVREHGVIATADAGCGSNSSTAR